MTFGDWFTAEFNEYNEANPSNPITYSEIAERVKCSKAYISHLANDVLNGSGKRIRPDEDIVDGIAEIFGASRSKARLAAGLAPPEGAMPTPNPFLDQIERKLRRVEMKKRPMIERLLLSDLDKYAAQL